MGLIRTVLLGFFQGWSETSPQASIIIQPPPAHEWQSQEAPGLRAEGGLMLPATTYRPPNRGYKPELATGDGSVIARPRSQASASRSPRFKEHLDETEDYFAASSPYNTSADSPTLGKSYKALVSPSLADQVRRQQYLNNRGENTPNVVSSSPPKVRTPTPVSPLTMNGTLQQDFAVSPLFSRHQNKYR